MRALLIGTLGLAIIATIFARTYASYITSLLMFFATSASFIFTRNFKIKTENDEKTIATLSASLERHNTLLHDLIPAIDLLVAEDTAICSATRTGRRPLMPLEPSLPPFEGLSKFARTLTESDPSSLRRLYSIAELSETAKQLKAIELRLPYIEALLERVVRHTENAALILTERFGAITEQTEKAEKQANETIVALGMDGDAGQSLDSLVRQSHETITNTSIAINDFIRLNKENADRLRKLSTLVSKSVELIAGIEDIAERSKLITFNLAVESAKIGEKGLGFKVIVHELQGLNDQTTDFARDILEIVKSFRTSNQELLDLWLVRAEALTDKVRTDSAQAETTVTALMRSYDATGTLFRSLSESTFTVNQALGDVVESLQFQDITRQQIEGVSSFIDDIGIRIKELRSLFESTGFSPGDRHEIQKEIRERFMPKLKVTSDHSIFDLLERR